MGDDDTLWRQCFATLGLVYRIKRSCKSFHIFFGRKKQQLLTAILFANSWNWLWKPTSSKTFWSHMIAFMSKLWNAYLFKEENIYPHINQIHFIYYRIPESEKAKTFRIARFFTQKLFRIKRVNRDTFAFATKVRKTREFQVFLVNPESFYTIRTVSWLSREFLSYPGSLWNLLNVFKLSVQSLDCPDSFKMSR